MVHPIFLAKVANLRPSPAISPQAIVMVDLHRSGAHRVPLWSGGPGVTSHAGHPKHRKNCRCWINLGATCTKHPTNIPQTGRKFLCFPYQSYQRSRGESLISLIMVCFLEASSKRTKRFSQSCGRVEGKLSWLTIGPDFTPTPITFS